MRDLINIVENARRVPSPSELTAAIRTKIEAWGKRPYDINNGMCEDFAEEIVRDLIGDETSEFFTVWGDEMTEIGDDGFANLETWDVATVQRLSPGSHPTHGLTWEDCAGGIPNHCWIILHGRNYDAECPEGVDNLFELPLVRRGMERMSGKVSESVVLDEIYHMDSGEMSPSLIRQKIQEITRKGGFKLLKQVDARTKILKQERGPRSFDVLVTRDNVGVGYVWVSGQTLADVAGLAITEIGLVEQLRGEGLGKAIYNALLDTGLPLLSGGQQTPDGQRMWRWLIGRSDLHAYVVDLQGDDDILYPLEDSPIDPWKVPHSRIIVSKQPLGQ